MEEKYKSQLVANGADIKNALKHFMGKEEMYEKYLIKFFLEEPNYDKLMASLDNKDYTEAFRCVHTLKGVSINLGLMPLYRELYDLTEELRGKAAEEVNLAAVSGKKNKIAEIYGTFADIIRESQSS